MSFALNMIGKGFKGVGTPLGKLAVGGAPGRMFLGGIAGGIAGGITSDRNDPTNRASDIFRGAFLGATLGGASRMFTPGVKFTSSGMKYLPSGIGSAVAGVGMGNIARGAGTLVSGTARVARAGGSAILSVAKAAYRNPRLTTYGVAGIAGGAMTLNAIDNYRSRSHILENSEMRTSMQQEMNMLDQMNSGLAPMGGLVSGKSVRNRHLMDSTMGLVGGMHRGRHGT